ncbi:Endoribonuclease YbeY [compost metagenome]
MRKTRGVKRVGLKLAWNNEQEDFEISQELIELLEKALDIAGEAEGIMDGEVDLTFVNNEAIHELNREYRGIDRPTDVLSFAMNESVDEEPEILYELEEGQNLDDIPDVLGDIIISVERAKEQSEEYGHSLEREIGFLFVHGFLHLLGYDHQDEASEAEMMAKQEAALSQVGLVR